MINFKYFTKNLILNPKDLINESFSDLKKDINYKKFNKNPNRIWICGLPKSGTTLIEKILDYLPYLRVDRSIFRSFPDKDFLNEKNIEEYIRYFPTKKFTYVKTHLNFNQKIVETLVKNRFKIIVTFRDIRDAMISRYYHILSDKNHWQHDIVKSQTFEKGFIKSLTEYTDKFPKHLKFEEPITSYYNWIKNWKQFDDQNIKKIWFESYKSDPLNFIEDLLKFTNFQNLNKNKILDGLIKKNKEERDIPLIKKLKRTNKNVSTFRSGKVGEWKELFNKKIESEFYKSLPGEISQILN